MKIFFFTIGLLASIQAGWATSFYEVPFPESVHDAPVIVRGTTGTGQADWGHERDGGKRIFTYYDLKVAEVFKGVGEPQNSTLRMREMGGEKDGTGMQVAGASSFSPGEDVVVFLGEKNSEGSYDVWGMMMGKFTLKKDANGQEVLAGPGLAGPGLSGSAGAPAKTWTLASLRELVASQGAVPGAGAHRVPGPTPTTASPRSVDERAAPQLQPSSNETGGKAGGETGNETGAATWWAAALAGLGVCVAIGLLARKR